MNRRDTIIIAVLLNAGLLIVLFATSLKPETAPAIESTPIVQQISQPPATIISAPMTSADTQPLPSASSMAASPQITSIADEVEAAARQYTPPAVASETSANFGADMSFNPPAPVLEPKPEPSYKEVKVKKGDALEKIARHHHVSVEELMKANQLTSTRLKIGQTLKIPSKQAELSSAPAEQAESAIKYYTVKNGDNPWTIAVKNHMKVEDLLKLNNMNEQQAKRLKVGDKLRIQ